MWRAIERRETLGGRDQREPHRPSPRLNSCRAAPTPTPLWVWQRVSVVGPALRAGRRRVGRRRPGRRRPGRRRAGRRRAGRRRAGRRRAGRRRAGRSLISIQAIMKLLTTWFVVEAAVTLASVLGRERIAKVGVSRGRWCGPHNTSGQGCRCSTDRGHQYSRLHVGIPFLWKTTALCRRWLQR